MENILVFSYITIMYLFAIIMGSKYAMSAKIGILLYMRYKKDEYPISTTMILWFIIHILAILLAVKIFIPLIPFRPFFID